MTEVLRQDATKIRDEIQKWPPDRARCIDPERLAIRKYHAAREIYGRRDEQVPIRVDGEWIRWAEWFKRKFSEDLLAYVGRCQQALREHLARRAA